jgi:hypothetical protein
MFISSDYGESWNIPNLSDYFDKKYSFNDVCYDNITKCIYVATAKNNYIYKSTDSGTTWVLFIKMPYTIYSLAINENFLIASSRSGYVYKININK